MLSLFLAITKRDLLLAFRNRTDVLVSLFFFIIVITLFPLALNVANSKLPELGAGLVWVAALLASILSFGRLFEQDYQDGSLDAVLSSGSIYSCVLAKIFAHWLVTGLPLVVISLFAGLAYGMDRDSINVMLVSLTLGTPILSLIGAIGASLTLGLRNGSSLIALLILPLNVPVMIYGAAAIRESVADGSNTGSYLLILAAILTVSAVFAPLVAAAGLKISND